MWFPVQDRARDFGRSGHAVMNYTSALAQASDGQFIFGAFLILGAGIFVHRYRTRCRNPKCGRWAKEIQGARYVKKTETTKADDWVMENTQTLVREDDRIGATPWGDSRRQVRETFHERVKYEVETTITVSSIPCHCRQCGFTWEHDLPLERLIVRRRVG